VGSALLLLHKRTLQATLCAFPTSTQSISLVRSLFTLKSYYNYFFTVHKDEMPVFALKDQVSINKYTRAALSLNNSSCLCYLYGNTLGKNRDATRRLLRKEQRFCTLLSVSGVTAVNCRQHFYFVHAVEISVNPYFTV
jgi:hypothetical protein